MVIEVNTHARAILVNGYRIQTAPAVVELLRFIGTPDRIECGRTPAPPGFRNNHQHVFDSLGLHVNEHHQTCRAQEIGITLDAAERRYPHTPKAAFTGQLLFDSVAMPLNATEQEFLNASPWPFGRVLAGIWSYRFDGFFVGFQAVGRKLASGRSKQRIVVDISLSWPHDPHGQPSTNG